MRARALALSFALACATPPGPDLPDVILVSVGVQDAEGPPPDVARLLPAVVFEQAYLPAPHPAPTLVSLLTGLYPETHGVLAESDSLHASTITLSGLLAQRGYAIRDFTDASDTADTAEWLSAGSPRFAFIRRGSAAASDIAELLGGLDGADALRDTLVIFAAPRGPAADGERALLEPAIRATLLISFPSGGALRVEDPVQLIDVLPTVLDYLGLDAPRGVQGRSLLPLVREPAVERAERPVYVRTPSGSQYAVRAGRWKLIQPGAPRDARLFDLVADPGETRDVADAHPLERARLQRLLALWQLHTRAERPSD